MLDYSFQNNTLKFEVHVVPRASCSEIAGAHNGALKIRIAAPPVDGAANEELVRTLAKAFGVSRNAVEIVRGHSAKLKTVRISGASPAVLEVLSVGDGVSSG